MSAPIGSIVELKELLEGSGKQYVFEDRQFPFYGVLIYSHIKGLNGYLSKYVTDNFELFNAQTGPNWLVAVLEDIQGTRQNEFKPEDVYKIARYLGVSVDDIPAIVFFCDPKERNDTYVLKLSDLIKESDEYDEELIHNSINTISSIIDEVCKSDEKDIDRLQTLKLELDRRLAMSDLHEKRLQLQKVCLGQL